MPFSMARLLMFVGKLAMDDQKIGESVAGPGAPNLEGILEEFGSGTWWLRNYERYVIMSTPD